MLSIAWVVCGSLAATARCTLPAPTLFHDVPVRNIVGTTDSYGAYRITAAQAGAPGAFIITSLNGSFAPIAARRNGSTLRAVFPNLNRTLIGETGASGRNCTLFTWRDDDDGTIQPPFLRQLVYEWQLGPLPPPAAQCVFVNAVWHNVPQTLRLNASNRAVYIFRSLDATRVVLRSSNGSWPDVVANVSSPPHGDLRTISARFPRQRGTLSTGRLRDAGAASCAFIEWDVGRGPPQAAMTSAGEVWEAGPLPPPPPPPPAPCEQCYTARQCDAALPPSGGSDRCTWCTDKVHALCFHVGDEPPAAAGWTCDREGALGWRGASQEPIRALQ